MNTEINLRTYTGTKTIKATPMGASDAKHYGAQITEETIKKNIGNPGYLVEYPDGYRSWSPKKAFEDAYRLSETYIDRLRIEHEDLKARYLKGQEFMYSEKFNILSVDEQMALSVQMDVMRKYLAVLASRIKYAEARRYELDAAYLKGEMSMEDFVEATCDNISKGNPDAEEKSDDKKETKKFYQIGAHVVLHDDKEGDIEEDHTFIVQTISAVRANMLIEKWLRDKQEERFRESLKHPERTFVKYQINSFIEESKIIPIGCFIPVSFSEVYNDRANDD